MEEPHPPPFIKHLIEFVTNCIFFLFFDMKETLKFINLLNRAYTGYAPIVLSADFDKSMGKFVSIYNELLGLDYAQLLNESTTTQGKEWLEKYRNTRDSFEYSLHFVRDQKDLFSLIPYMFKNFKTVINKLKEDGIWTDEQWIKFRFTLSDIEAQTELRLKQFLAAYGLKDKTTQSLNPEPQQEEVKPTRGRGRPKETLKEKMMDDSDGGKLQKMHTKIDGKKGKDVALIILACIKKGWMTKPTFTQVKNEFGDIGCKTGYNRYLNEQMFTKEELEGAISSLD